jgi:hypothetical protein
MKLKRFQHSDLSGGVQNKTSHILANSNQVEHALNCNFDDTIGEARGREGSSRESVVESGHRTLNMFIHRQGTARHYLAVAEDGTDTNIMKSSTEDFSGSWALSLARTINNDVNMAMFGTKTYAFNGTDTPREYNGSTWVAKTEIPTAILYPEVYGQRLFGLSKNGFLYWSDVISASGVGFTTTGWTNRGINPNDGQDAMMLKRHRGRLVIIKEESIYRYDGTNEPDADINIGTHSGRSVVTTDSHLYFHYKHTIQQLGAGEPVNISRPVEKYLKGMDTANWKNVASGKDGNNIYTWIGDVTIKDTNAFDYNVTYSDVVLVFNYWTERWTVYTNWNARTWFIDNEKGETYFGTEAGEIVKINTGDFVDTRAEDEPINFMLRYHKKDFGFPERTKQISEIHLVCRNGVNLRAGTQKNSLDIVGQTTDGISTINKDIVFKNLYMEASATYNTEPPIVKELIINSSEIFNTKRNGQE